MNSIELIWFLDWKKKVKMMRKLERGTAESPLIACMRKRKKLD